MPVLRVPGPMSGGTRMECDPAHCLREGTQDRTQDPGTFLACWLCWASGRGRSAPGAAMSYGLQISASGVMTSLYAQDVYANNLANMDTPGFKPEIPSIMPRLAVRQEDHLPFMPSNALLERLGGGALLEPHQGRHHA